MQKNLKSIAVPILISFVTASHVEAKPATMASIAADLALTSAFIAGLQTSVRLRWEVPSTRAMTKTLRTALTENPGDAAAENKLKEAMEREKSLLRRLYAAYALTALGAGGLTLPLLAKIVSRARYSKEDRTERLTIKHQFAIEKSFTQTFDNAPSLQSLFALVNHRKEVDKSCPQRTEIAPNTAKKIAALRENTAEREEGLLKSSVESFEEMWNRLCLSPLTYPKDEQKKLMGLQTRLEQILTAIPIERAARAALPSLAAAAPKLDWLDQLQTQPAQTADKLEDHLKRFEAEIASDQPLEKLERELEPILWAADLATKQADRSYAANPKPKKEIRALRESIQIKLEARRAATSLVGERG